MVQIKIEIIGDNIDEQVKMFSYMCDSVTPGLSNSVIGKHKKRGWCCQITGKDNKYTFKRFFLTGNKDYRHGNSLGSRGVYEYYNLEEGNVYEISSPVSWKKDDRYFCKIVDNKLLRISKEEVLEWVNSL